MAGSLSRWVGLLALSVIPTISALEGITDRCVQTEPNQNLDQPCAPPAVLMSSARGGRLEAVHSTLTAGPTPVMCPSASVTMGTMAMLLTVVAVSPGFIVTGVTSMRALNLQPPPLALSIQPSASVIVDTTV